MKNRTNHEINKFLQQNSPINNELVRNKKLSYLLHPDESMTRVTSRSANGNNPSVITLCSFRYDQNADFRNLAKRITAIDRRVHNALCTLWVNDKHTTSINQIYSIITGYSRGNPTSNQLLNIEKSLEKMNNINVYIDLTEELNKKIINNRAPLIAAKVLKDNLDAFKKVEISDKMINIRMTKTKSVKNRCSTTIEILSEPALLTYNLSKKTIINIPIEYLAFSSNSTEKSIAFQDYILTRVMSYQNGAMNENKILYKTLYRDSGVPSPTKGIEKIRDRKKIKSILDDLIKNKVISSYREEKTGKSYTCFIFTIE